MDLAAYPFREFGQLQGKVTDIDAVAVPDAQGMFRRTVTVALPDSLVTTYGRRINFQQNLTGTARIITQDRTLLERLFDQFLNLNNNS